MLWVWYDVPCFKGAWARVTTPHYLPIIPTTTYPLPLIQTLPHLMAKVIGYSVGVSGWLAVSGVVCVGWRCPAVCVCVRLSVQCSVYGTLTRAKKYIITHKLFIITYFFTLIFFAVASGLLTCK